MPGSDQPVDLGYNLRTETLPDFGVDAAAAAAARRQSQSKSADTTRVCYFCAGGLGKRDRHGRLAEKPLRALHPFVHCPKRKRAGRREFSNATAAAVQEPVRT